jgi:uncharacterized membrane protein YczE
MKTLQLRILKTTISMFITAIGIVMMMKANIGLNPWWTFTFGISQISGISTGVVVQIFGLLFILIALLLGVKPGITTILDMILIGVYIDIISKVPLPVPDNIILQILVSIMGLIILCLGLSLTVSTGLGAGPKDSFTFALMKKTNKSINQIKLIVEGSTFVLGILIGGPFGIGTIIATLFTGQLLSIFFKKLHFDPAIAYKRS